MCLMQEPICTSIRPKRHRLTARLENLFDVRHVTGMGSAILADSASQQRFLWERLAPPRSVHLNYTYNFR